VLKYDLHSHSYYSDGKLSPTDLVERAKSQGVDVLALTDHDTTEGLAEASEAAEACGLKLIPGVEISTGWRDREIHIVALNIDANHPVLSDGLAEHQQKREQRARAIAEKLANVGMADVYAGVKALSGPGVIGRLHFATYLVNSGQVKDFRAAFKYYLAKNKPAYVPTGWASLPEVITWILKAGGRSVLAHPLRYKLTTAQLKLLLKEFRAYGGSGVEVITSHHDAAEIRRIVELSRQYGLLASMGSDFHMPSAWTELGRLQPLPANCELVI